VLACAKPASTTALPHLVDAVLVIRTFMRKSTSWKQCPASLLSIVSQFRISGTGQRAHYTTFLQDGSPANPESLYAVIVATTMRARSLGPCQHRHKQRRGIPWKDLNTAPWPRRYLGHAFCVILELKKPLEHRNPTVSINRSLSRSQPNRLWSRRAVRLTVTSRLPIPFFVCMSETRVCPIAQNGCQI
jgi:hypothetical protein